MARQLHVGRVLGETHGHVVGLQAHRGLDVFHVLGGQRRRGQPAALLVDALVVGQLATELDGGVHRVAEHLVDGHHDQPVVEQQRVARLHVARQFLVVQAHATDVARLGARGVEHKRLSGFEHHLAFGELADANLGALQVGHDADLAAGAFGRRTDHVGAVNVVLRLSVREVHAHDIDAGPDHGF
ncbi:MAG: hypothetical protein U5N10_18595 [Gemmobacter sp.]|nr:hypothetical protein [Gemmobacter sp.]